MAQNRKHTKIYPNKQASRTAYRTRRAIREGRPVKFTRIQQAEIAAYGVPLVDCYWPEDYTGPFEENHRPAAVLPDWVHELHIAHGQRDARRRAA